jgi:hypothetical protein
MFCLDLTYSMFPNTFWLKLDFLFGMLYFLFAFGIGALQVGATEFIGFHCCGGVSCQIFQHFMLLTVFNPSQIFVLICTDRLIPAAGGSTWQRPLLHAPHASVADFRFESSSFTSLHFTHSVFACYQFHSIHWHSEIHGDFCKYSRTVFFACAPSTSSGDWTPESRHSAKFDTWFASSSDAGYYTSEFATFAITIISFAKTRDS